MKREGTTIQKTISLPEGTKTKGIRNARLRGFANSFSAFVAKLIEEDDERLAATGKGKRK